MNIENKKRNNNRNKIRRKQNNRTNSKTRNRSRRDRLDEFDELIDFDSQMDHELGAKHTIIPVLIALFLICVVIAGAVGSKFIEKYSYSKTTMDLAQYYQLTSDSEATILLGDEMIEAKALVMNGEYYLPLSFVQDKLNSRFFYAKQDGLLLYTTPTQLFEIAPDSATYTISGEEKSYSQTIFVMKDEPYINAGFLGDYANFLLEGFQMPNRIQLYIENQTHQVAMVTKNTDIRYQGGVKSDILIPVEKGQTLYILEEMENWSKVKSQNGVIGYVENKRLNAQPDEQIQIPQSYVQPEYTSMHKDYTINMAWHQVTNEVANSGIDQLLTTTKAVNTISPTWFFLNDNFGNFTSIASQDYVNNMHGRGIEVWALIDNFTNDVDIAQILGSLANRKNLIQNLVQTVLSYQIDGINIDFEQVPNEAGGDYVQFLRELSIACRLNQIVLSVDNYVPTGYTAHYDRREQGTVVDYVVIMGYDEHYSGSAEAGSVASLDYVRQGIENTVSMVPSEKVINGIPFYTRLWKLGDGLSSEALSMGAAENYLSQYGVTTTWDEMTSQNYATWQADGVTYQLWLEDMDSLNAKLSVMSMYPLGGIAQWKLGLEKPEVWDSIASYVNGTFSLENQMTEGDLTQEPSEDSLENMQTEDTSQTEDASQTEKDETPELEMEVID